MEGLSSATLIPLLIAFWVGMMAGILAHRPAPTVVVQAPVQPQSAPDHVGFVLALFFIAVALILIAVLQP